MKLLQNNPPADPACADFIQPRSFNKVGKTALWAADNGAFRGLDERRFLKMLDAIVVAEVRGRDGEPA